MLCNTHAGERLKQRYSMTFDVYMLETLRDMVRNGEIVHEFNDRPTRVKKRKKLYSLSRVRTYIVRYNLRYIKFTYAVDIEQVVTFVPLSNNDRQIILSKYDTC